MKEAATHDCLDALARDGHLAPDAWRRARELAGITPDGARWRELLASTFTLGAGLLLGTALVFFIAYNWNEMGRIARLVLVESAVVATSIAGVWLGPRTLPGRSALFAAIIALGATLAFIGQTYQTGADPWQLFFGWAVLALPWAIAAGWAPTWAAVLVIANLATALYFGEAWRPVGSIFNAATVVVTALTVVNVAAAIGAEWAGPKGDDGVHRMLPRLAVLIALGAATSGMVWWLWDSDELQLPAGFAAVAGGCWYACRVRGRDLLLLSALALSGIVVVTAGLVRMLEKVGDPSIFLMLIALVVVGLSALAANWIRNLAKQTP